MKVMPNVNYVPPSKNKDQPRDVYNYLNQKVITTINTLDGSKYEPPSRLHVLSAHSSCEAVENNQEHFVVNKVGSIMLLVYYLLLPKKPCYA